MNEENASGATLGTADRMALALLFLVVLVLLRHVFFLTGFGVA